MKALLLNILFIFLSLSLYAQFELFGIGTKWDDSFKEWTIFTSDEDVEGDLSIRWITKNDWKEWDYRLEDESGSIKMKFHNDPSKWEVRGGGEIISMQTKWRGDNTEWRITDGSVTLTIKSKYRTNLEEWEIQENKYGAFEMYTTYENDIRDWEIIDELSDEISFHFKMALLFVVAYNSTPKI